MGKINEISKEKLSQYVKRAVTDHGMSNFSKRQTVYADEKKYFANRERKRRKGIAKAINKLDRMEEEEEMELDEGVTKKHFKMAADSIKAISDPEKRKEHANMHADLYAKQNPRFDRAKFMKAAGVNEDTKEIDLEPDEIEDEQPTPAEAIVAASAFDEPVEVQKQFNVAMTQKITDRIGELKDEIRDRIFSFHKEEVDEDDLDEEHLGFKKLENKLAHKKGIYNPAGLAAKIGREKYGKKKFQAKAEAGKED
jgi:hypothetical protein